MKTLGVFLFLMIMTGINAQSLKDLQWEKRVVILAGTDSEIKGAISLYNNELGKEERKILFLISEENGLGNQKGGTIYPKPKFVKAPNKFYLIGLDGGLKLKSKEYLSQKELFNTIDSMPMRASEIRRKNE